MIDHILLAVSDLNRSAKFFAAYVWDPDGYNVEALFQKR